MSKNARRKKSFFSHKKVPLYLPLFNAGSFHRAGLHLCSGHWAVGGVEMVLFGEGSITYWGLSLRESQSLAELFLWGWVGSVSPLHS